MPIHLVPDATWKGKGVAPLMVRADAMRKFYKAGHTVVEVAEHFEVPYRIAYKAIQPPRQRATSPSSTAPKALTKERLSSMTKSQLLKAAESKDRTPAGLKRSEAAADELEARWPGWIDSLGK